MINITKIHNNNKYSNFAQEILDDEGTFYEEFSEWVSSNELELKTVFSKSLFQNEDDTLDYSFLEWALEKWVVDNYNKLRVEIDSLVGEF